MESFIFELKFINGDGNLSQLVFKFPNQSGMFETLVDFLKQYPNVKILSVTSINNCKCDHDLTNKN